MEVDATLSMSSENFSKLFSGQLRTTTAFISGRMKISGNLGKATRLEKLLAKLQSQNPNKVQSEATFVESKPVMRTPWTDEVLRFSGSFHKKSIFSSGRQEHSTQSLSKATVGEARVDQSKWNVGLPDH